MLFTKSAQRGLYSAVWYVRFVSGFGIIRSIRPGTLLYALMHIFLRSVSNPDNSMTLLGYPHRMLSTRIRTLGDYPLRMSEEVEPW